MGFTKNSTDWLQPIELDEEESKRFLKALKKPLNKGRLKKQAALFEIAQEIMDKSG